VFTIEADDGFPLVIERLASPSRITAGGPPVVLCHGFGGNRYNFDVDERHSLARYLLNRGFDVWLVELRGHGRSKRKPSSAASRGWNMDDHVDMDMPAMLQAIRQFSGRDDLFWIGHSLGGTIAYCLLARRPEFGSAFAGVITIGSPARVDRPPGVLLAPAMLLLLRAFGHRETLPGRAAARVVFSAAARRFGARAIWRRWVSPENIDQGVIERTVRHGLEDLSISTLQQWARSLSDCSLLTADGTFDYSCALQRIRVPMLFVAGTCDRIASVDAVRAAFERVGSADKRLRVFGRNGSEQQSGRAATCCSDCVDYGHEDLLLGEASRLELFPYIADWIRERDPGSSIYDRA
jgi:pimeloyl-ACP methyl ester carboxylesterase